MKEGNFFKNIKKGLEVAGAVTLTAIPSKTGDKQISNQEFNLPAIHAEVIKPKEINPDTTGHFNDKKEEQQKNNFETFINRERINKTINILRDDVINQIPKDIESHYNNRYKKYEKIYSHDHAILALGDNPKFSTKEFLELIGKTGDSIYYEKSPKMSFEGFLAGKNLHLYNDEQKAKALDKIKSDYDSLAKEGSFQIQNGFEDYLSIHRNWIEGEKLSQEEKKYNEYLEDTRRETREYHLGSTAYALLRSGAYDKLIKEGGENAELVKKIIDDISNPAHYQCDAKNPDNLIISRFGSTLNPNEVEWITTAILELKKKGIEKDFSLGSNVGNPVTLKELNNINQKRLDFMLDTTMSTEEKFSKKESELRSKTLKIEGLACDGAHTLDALTMYDVYTKDSIKLNEHLTLATKMLEKKLLETKIPEKKNEIMNLIHDLSHELLPFTELPNDFELNPEMKKTVQLAIKRMIENVEYMNIRFGGLNDVNNASHTIDILEHLPDCVLKK
ncbi:hypothetical protein IT400_04170 [Candidatus Nomurabacteria bacterium]|nr:hypothetical protein [Candidatus Nomurabacteria bacterium]